MEIVKINLSHVMKRAWQIFKNLPLITNFSSALKLAWKEAKAIANPEIIKVTFEAWKQKALSGCMADTYEDYTEQDLRDEFADKFTHKHTIKGGKIVEINRNFFTYTPDVNVF